MRVLHTSDWHLGKKLNGIDRLNEQACVLKEIAEIARREEVDIVLVAGDVFDNSFPQAAAERLFYEAVLELTEGGKRLVVVSSGNHDDPVRLAAAASLAANCGIIIENGGEFVLPDSLCGFNIVKSGRRGVVIEREGGGERVCLGVNGFLSDYRIYNSGGELGEGDYSARAVRALREGAACFSEGAINIQICHIYTVGALKAGIESELGTASHIDPALLPKAHYTALGHIHRFFAVDKQRAIYYSGAPMRFCFDDDYTPVVVVTDLTSEGIKDIKTVEIVSAKKLFRLECDTLCGAHTLLNQHSEGLVELTLRLDKPPLSADLRELKRPHLARLRLDIKEKASASLYSFEGLGAKELFMEYFKSLNDGSEPKSELVDLFLEMIEEEK